MNLLALRAVSLYLPAPWSGARNSKIELRNSLLLVCDLSWGDLDAERHWERGDC